MSYSATISEGVRPSPAPGAPLIHYWEVVWNRMHRAGWQMGHTTFTDLDTGGVRHMVFARRDGVELRRSAPTMTLAVQALEQAARSAS